jgi:FKBP-type peptidyl-prolyl cis-trans isomerase 2/predicted Fe-Mo cluster-binding NifX family protein
MLIAVPSDSPGGLDAAVSEHFGHAVAFTLIEVEDGQVGEVSILENGGHDQGGCMAPVMLLKKKGVETLVAGGIGGRPLAGFQQVGIAVHSSEQASTVRDAVERFIAGACPAFDPAQTCEGGGGHCGGHHHEPIVRKPVEGVADIRDGRFVTLEFELRDTEGNLLDSSDRHGPMQYLHGAGQLLPALEAGVSGLEVGQSKAVALECDDAFGRRADERIIEVPRAHMPPDVSEGDMVAGQDQAGNQIPLLVVELGTSTATLDGNHPFADKDVVFKVTVVNVEQATEQELAFIQAH